MTGETLAELMGGIGRAAGAAAQVLAHASTETKNRALRAGAAALRAQASKILAANESDLNEAVERKTSGAFLDRLRLDDKRIDGHGPGARGGRTSPRSGRNPLGRMDAAQWHANRARERALRSDRHHL